MSCFTGKNKKLKTLTPLQGWHVNLSESSDSDAEDCVTDASLTRVSLADHDYCREAYNVANR